MPPGVIVAAHGAGHAVVVKEWVDLGGASGIARSSLVVVILSAALVALAGLAVVAIGEAVWVRPAGRWRGIAPARPGYAGLGVAVAVLLPLVWAVPGPTALMFALPWGAGLAAAGWLRGRAAVATGVTVVVSAFLCAAFTVGAHVLAYCATPPGGD